LTADDMDDIVAMTMFTHYGVHLQHNTANGGQLSANQIGIK